MRVTAGTSNPMETSLSPCENTSSTVPYSAASPRFITSAFVAIRAMSSMLWETRMTVLPVSVR